MITRQESAGRQSKLPVPMQWACTKATPSHDYPRAGREPCFDLLQGTTAHGTPSSCSRRDTRLDQRLWGVGFVPSAIGTFALVVLDEGLEKHLDG